MFISFPVLDLQRIDSRGSGDIAGARDPRVMVPLEHRSCHTLARARSTSSATFAARFLVGSAPGRVVRLPRCSRSDPSGHRRARPGTTAAMTFRALRDGLVLTGELVARTASADYAFRGAGTRSREMPSTAPQSAALLIGFERKSSMPAAKQRSRSAGRARAVSAITGR
jgi:hypothetical protein